MIKTLYSPFARWSSDGSVYIISDTHFGDADCKLMNESWPEPDEAIAVINSVVTNNDTLIVLGDVGDASYFRHINANRKVLILGNHDSGASKYARDKRTVSFDAKEYNMNSLLRHLETEYPDKNCVVRKGARRSLFGRKENYFAIIDNGLFDEVYTGPLMVGEKLMLSHEKVSLPFVTNIHGHEHGGVMRYKNEYGCNCLNVASDVCGFRPINLGAEINNGLLSNTPSIHRLAIEKRL